MDSAYTLQPGKYSQASTSVSSAEKLNDGKKSVLVNNTPIWAYTRAELSKSIDVYLNTKLKMGNEK